MRDFTGAMAVFMPLPGFERHFKNDRRLFIVEYSTPEYRDAAMEVLRQNFPDIILTPETPTQFQIDFKGE